MIFAVVLVKLMALVLLLVLILPAVVKVLIALKVTAPCVEIPVLFTVMPPVNSVTLKAPFVTVFVPEIESVPTNAFL